MTGNREPTSDATTGAAPDGFSIELTEDDLALVETALRLLEQTLGREEADELEAVQRLLARLPRPASRAS